MLKPSKQNAGYVVSDLHIFGSSSLYARRLPSFQSSVQHYPVVVLNGDTFDFKRSIYGSSRETTRYAIEWLSHLCESAPLTKFLFVVGNHDCQSILTDAVSELATTNSNLQLCPAGVRLGPCLFVHGDAIDLRHSHHSLADVRRRYAHVEPSRASKMLAGIITHLRLNAIEPLRHSKQYVAKKILDYVSSLDSTAMQGVHAIYCGHTHVPFEGFQYGDITFYNTGSLIRGLRWNPMEFPLEQNWSPVQLPYQ